MAFTFFFRDMQTLEAIRDYVVPHLRGRRFIHIWDAGCARGAEPYSLAIILKEAMGYMLYRNVHIHATDVDEMDQFGSQIASAVYESSDVKRVPRRILEDNFEPVGDSGAYRLLDGIRKRLSFEKHNLLTLTPPRTDFSLVVCKNVLLHFQPRDRSAVIRMFHRALVDGGYLVMEQTQALPPDARALFDRVTPCARLYRKTPGPVEGPRRITLPRGNGERKWRRE